MELASLSAEEVRARHDRGRIVALG
jgi:hypothetical protein